MAGILPDLANECEAKRDRLIKDITNVDRSSVIPDHYNKSKSILELLDEAKNEHDRASFIRRMMTTEEQFSSDTNKWRTQNIN